MKKLRQLCVATVFILVLTSATFAGDIATPGRTQPTPPDESTATTPGDIATGGIQNPQATSDSVADLALNLLQTILSVF